MCDHGGVAGGMRRGFAREPMYQRVRAGRDADRSPGGPGGSVGGPAGGARHCWVLDPVDTLGVRRPGLLLEWRRGTRPGRENAWEGRVVYVVQLRAHGWQMVEEWLPAERLEPA